MTQAEAKAQFLRRVNQESTNHDFGSDDTLINDYLTDACVEMARDFPGSCRHKLTFATVSGQAGYSEAELGLGSLTYWQSWEIKVLTDPDDRKLIYIEPERYQAEEKSWRGIIWGWTIDESLVDSGSGVYVSIPVLYLIDTPGGVITLNIHLNIVPARLADAAAINLFPTRYRSLLPDAAAKLAMRDLGWGMWGAYIMKHDREINSVAGEEVCRKANVDVSVKGGIFLERKSRIEDY